MENMMMSPYLQTGTTSKISVALQTTNEPHLL